MSEQVASQNKVAGPVYPDDPTTVHKVKDMLSATLDLVEPSNIRLPGESEEHIAERIIEAYEKKYTTKLGYAPFVPEHTPRDEYAECLNTYYVAFGQIRYEDFKERPPITD